MFIHKWKMKKAVNNECVCVMIRECLCDINERKWFQSWGRGKRGKGDGGPGKILLIDMEKGVIIPF